MNTYISYNNLIKSTIKTKLTIHLAYISCGAPQIIAFKLEAPSLSKGSKRSNNPVSTLQFKYLA